MSDHVDRVLEQWASELPEVDSSPIAVFGRLSRAARAAEAQLSKNFARHGIDAAAYDVLATLRRHGHPYSLSARDLQAASMLTSSAVAQRVNRLEDRGWVTRTVNSLDARVTDVTLTDSGKAVLEAALPDHLDAERAMLASLSASERKTLEGALMKLIAAIDNAEGA